MDTSVGSTVAINVPIMLCQLDAVSDGAELEVAGWVRSKRETKRVCFIVISDGGAHSLQIVVEPDRLAPLQRQLLPQISTGAAITARGTLIHTPQRPQRYELQASQIALCGAADSATYPLQKKEHSSEFLRTIPHLRVRTATYGAIARVRSALSYAVHQFFHGEHFTLLHAPIITTHDAEGAGALFRVSHDAAAGAPTATAAGASSTATAAGASPTAAGASSTATAVSPTAAGAPPTVASDARPSQRHFFGAPAYLTVSGQLNAESYALAMRRAYTFGPTFRAEDSHTSRHLSEFWMVEPEIAFCDLTELRLFAERCLKAIISAAIESCKPEIALLCTQNPLLDATLERLQTAAYHCITYDEAIALLQRAEQPFTYPVAWGIDLQSEHEKWLLTHFEQTPLFIINYPSELKAFYMRVNDDRRTVAAIDLIVPEVGELIGGSQREEREPLLLERMQACAIDPTHYQWYLDLRRFGGAPHAGFGIGFDRLVQLVCGIKNIRDVVAFPRTPGQAFC